MQTIWGFDLGVTSVGWAVIRWDESGTRGEIIRMGVRVFPETREAARPGEVGDPLNAARRQKRLMRRTLRRKRWRRVHLRHALVEAGLLPKDAEPGKGRPGCPPKFGFEPYAARVQGLTEALHPHDLGWALFHLLKRRGFQGSRKYGTAEEEGAESPAPEQKAAKGKRNASEAAVESKEEAKKKKEEQEARTRRDQLAAEIAAIAASEGEERATLAAALQARRDPLVRARTAEPKKFHDPVRLRAAQQGRDMVKGEFEKLWSAQAPHHPALLTEVLKAKLLHIGFSQRPTFFRARTIGKCIYSPTEDRALKGDWLTQHFDTLKLVNDLRIARGNNPLLDAEQRIKALRYLEHEWAPTSGDKAKRQQRDRLRTAIGLDDHDRFTHERGEKETIRGNATEAALRKALGTAWQDLDETRRQGIRDAIGTAVRHAEFRPVRGGEILEIRDKDCWANQRAALAATAEREWDLAPALARALADISLPDGYAQHARSTMQRLLPHLETGKSYSEAVKIEFGSRRESAGTVPKLPGPTQSEINGLPRTTDDEKFVHEQMAALLAGIRNPTVLRTLGELQKVVNALLRKYGRPDLIRLELFRGLKQSREERATTDKRQMDQEKARTNAAERVHELGKPAKLDNVRRWLLCREQGGRSPYSGGPISYAQALDPAVTEIDHIFPVSRSFDPGPANQVLCFVDENRAKRNRTPFEWLTEEKPETWEMLRGTVWPAMQKCGWPGWNARYQRADGKWGRCLKESFETADGDTFTNRQATDSAFIATAARSYLGLLWGGGQQGINNVEPVPGRATSLLRRGWGLTLKQLLYGEIEGDDAPKARDDLRHHAVDALAVALCTRSKIKALSDWWQRKELRTVLPGDRLALPWPDLHAQAKASVEAIVVSHRVQAKLSGQLHKETNLGLRKDPYANQAPVLVLRKAVGSLAPNEIERIMDPAVRQRIETAIAEKGSLKEAAADGIRLPRADGSDGPPILKVRIRNRIQGTGQALPLRPHPKTFATGIALQHIALYGDERKQTPDIATQQAVLERKRRQEPLVPTSKNGQPLLMVLHVDDTLEKKTDGACKLIRVMRFESDGRIVFKPVEVGGTDDLMRDKKSFATLYRDGWRKVSVDAIGRIRPAK